MRPSGKVRSAVRPPFYRVVHDRARNEDIIETSLTGAALLGLPWLNKGTGFTRAERKEFGLVGLLPPHEMTLDQQMERVRQGYLREQTDLDRNIFLNSLHDRNETLFFKLLQAHITEMMPIYYTPVVGEQVRQYSHVYRRARGIYISYELRHEIDAILDNWAHPNVDAICVTDSEAILGIGDQGLGGMGIPVAKLVLYTLCAGVNPMGLMPVELDVGTNNQELLDDPLYLGWRHERLRGAEYDELIDLFVQAVKRRYPGVLLHWEDFGKLNSRRLLDKYRNEICSFNDDIQGTAAVTLAALIKAVEMAGSRFRDQQVVVFGAGTAGIGISDEIVSTMMREGLMEPEALSRMWLLNSKGLVTSESQGLEYFQKRYALPIERTRSWKLETPGKITLHDVVHNVHPTILIGTSTQPGAFTEELVRTMHARTPRPIIFPLSNPYSKCEATPEDLLRWTDGQALIATGTPFPEITYKGKHMRVGQCNNAFVFPGLALGTIVAKAKAITDGMITAAGRELAAWTPTTIDPNAALVPTLDDVIPISHRVAIAVAIEAMREGVAERVSVEELEHRIEAKKWPGRYYAYRLVDRSGGPDVA